MRQLCERERERERERGGETEDVRESSKVGGGKRCGIEGKRENKNIGQIDIEIQKRRSKERERKKAMD